MITVSKQENGVLFTFTNSDKYLYGSGTIEVPFNSLSIIQDESDNITLRKSSSNDIFLSARYDTDFGYASKEAAVEALKEILYDEAGISEEEVQEMIDAATSGIPSSEVVEQLRRDVNAVSGEVDTKQDILTAGENITISGNVISADNNIIELTQAEYDALETKDPEALYIITDAQEINMNDYYTKSEVYNKQEVDTAYETAYQALTAHTADTNVHVTQAEKNTWNGKVDEGYVTDYAYSKNQIDGFLENATTLLQAISGEVDTKVDTTTYESGQYATAQALNALQENKLDASAYTPTDLSEYWTSAQTQSAIDAATSGIPSSQVIEALRSDLNTVSGEVENKQDALQYYSEAEYENGGGRGLILVNNGKTYGASVDAEVGSMDSQAYASLYAKGEAGSNTLKVSPTGVTINDAKVLTENDINVNEIWNTIDEKEEVIASALTQLNQDVAEIDAKEEVIASALTEVRQDVADKQDALSAGTGIEISGNVISATGGALLVNFNDLMENMNDEKWDGLIDALQNNKPIFEGYNNSEEGTTEQNIVNGYVYPDEESDPDDEFGTITFVEVMSLRIDFSGGYRELIITKKGSEDYEVSEYSDNYQPMLTAGSGISIVNNVISADLSNYFTKSEVTTALAGKLDASAYTPTDLSEYWTSGQTQNAINAATSGIPSSQVIEQLRTDLNTLSGAVIDNEYTVSQAINSLNNRVTAVEEDTLTAGSGISISNNVISTSGVVMSQQVTQIVKLTQAQYDALSTKDNQVLYIVVD